MKQSDEEQHMTVARETSDSCCERQVKKLVTEILTRSWNWIGHIPKVKEKSTTIYTRRQTEGASPRDKLEKNCIKRQTRTGGSRGLKLNRWPKSVTWMKCTVVLLVTKLMEDRRREVT